MISSIISKNIKNIFLNLMLVFFGLLVGFVILEGILRIMTKSNNELSNTQIAISDSNGYTIFRSNFDDYVLSDETGKKIHVKTNSEGFVGHDYPLTKPTSMYRIALLGDSFVDGMQLDYEKTFPYLLENKLNENSASIKFEAMNFGVGGEGTIEELLRYYHNVEKYKPDAVILFFFPNDFDNNQYYLDKSDLFGQDNSEWYEIKQVNANFKKNRKDLKYQLLKYSYAIRYFDKLFRQNQFLSQLAVKIGLQHQGVMGAPKDGIYPGFFMFNVPLPDVQKTVFDFTAQVIRFFNDRVKKNNAKFIIVYIPQTEQLDKEMWEEKKKDNPKLNDYQWDFNQPNEFIGRIAAENNIPFLDLTPIFRDYYQKNPGKHLYNQKGKYFDGHFNEDGHLLTTQRLMDLLQTK